MTIFGTLSDDEVVSGGRPGILSTFGCFYKYSDWIKQTFFDRPAEIMKKAITDAVIKVK
jgi:hypothetical protein